MGVIQHFMNHIKKHPPVKKITFSFLFVIIVGAFLLSLPISNQDHSFLPILDALFTATSATCVTGLVTVVPATQFTLFGKCVLIALMQIGGIGLITLMAVFMMILKNRLTMNDKIALRELLNQDNLANFKVFLKDVVKYTLVSELIGAILMCFVFVPDYGLSSGIFVSLFTAVSAFCNAGFDIVGANSLMPYADNTLLNIIVMALIVLGGLGFIVWFEMKGLFHLWREKKMHKKALLHSFSIHTRLVLIMTVSLILVPALLFFILEFNNPETLGNMNFFDKIITSLFTSVTLRTAGFSTIPFVELHSASQAIMLLVMFIGGSPGGTAGGVKTTTIAVILLCVLRMLRGQGRTNVFHRHVSRSIIVRSTAVVCINFMVLFCGIIILCISEKMDFMTIVFEATSALATVGLSLNATPFLSSIGKIVIIWLMFVGRIGIMTFLMSIIRRKEKEDTIQYAEAHIVVG